MSEIAPAVIEFTIGSGTALSNIHRLKGRRIVAIEMPDAWDAADITFLSGHTEAALHSVYDDGGSEVSVVVAVDRIVSITGAKADSLAALDQLQIRSGSESAPVNQTDDRTIYLLVK